MGRKVNYSKAIEKNIFIGRGHKHGKADNAIC